MHFYLRGCHALWPAFPDRSINDYSIPRLTNCSLHFWRSTVDYCGPATPGSPFELPGLGFSDFARHYFRNHGCFLFLRVLRWFTSPSSLRHPMDSGGGNRCSHRLGFPIRKSPDHSLLAASRSLSQLIASFIAYLRQGIHTHALSSLTIKLTPDTAEVSAHVPYSYSRHGDLCVLPINIQLSKIIRHRLMQTKNRKSAFGGAASNRSLTTSAFLQGAGGPG